MPLLGSTLTEVVIPIVTAALGVLAGFLPTWYAARHRSKSERRGHLRELATEFAERLGGAANAVRYALGTRERGSLEQKAVDDAQWLLGEVAAGLPRVRLRLGAESGSAAKLAIDELRSALDLLRAGNVPLEEARAAYERASKAEDDFMRATRAELGEG